MSKTLLKNTFYTVILVGSLISLVNCTPAPKDYVYFCSNDPTPHCYSYRYECHPGYPQQQCYCHQYPTAYRPCGGYYSFHPRTPEYEEKKQHWYAGYEDNDP